MKGKIKEILWIVLLGAIGSGIWSLVGEPTAGWFYEFAQHTGGNASEYYLNEVNKGIGAGGFEDRGSMFFVTLFVIFFSASVFVFSQALIIKHLPLRNSIKYSLVAVAAIFIGYQGIGEVHHLVHSHKANLYYMKHIELLAPFVDEKEVLLAKSKYRQIDDKATMDSAQEYLLMLSEKAGVKIEPFSI